MMDVTLTEVVEPDNTSIGRAACETDCMVACSMMEAIKDPAFNHLSAQLDPPQQHQAMQAQDGSLFDLHLQQAGD